jgi:uncharacterized membrane protein HdeD (DUF308 family)
MVVLVAVIKPSLAVMIAVIVVGYVVALACAVYVIYHLLKRRSAHFRRDSELRSGILGYLKAKAAQRRKEAEVSSEITTMNLIHSEALGEEREKSAVMWTILTFLVPFVCIYVLYFLTKDAPNHDRRQLAFMQQAQSAGSKLGISLVVPSWKSLPERSFALYFILSLIISIFMIYWYYVLIKDFNEHFKAQWQLEDQLVPSIS